MNPSIPSETERSDPSVANEAFKLLSDGTRLEILQALWEAHDPADETPVRFAELRERVGVDDPGRLNYHLNRLAENFVRRTEDGYELTDSGKRIVRTLLSGTAVDDPEIEPVAVDVSCWYCGDNPSGATGRDGAPLSVPTATHGASSPSRPA